MQVNNRHHLPVKPVKIAQYWCCQVYGIKWELGNFDPQIRASLSNILTCFIWIFSFSSSSKHWFTCSLLIFLLISVKPTLSAPQTTVQALKGSNPLLAVTVALPVYPPLLKDNFTWFNESRHVVDKKLVLPNGNLKKTGVTVGDTGDYTCLAVNAGGNGSTTVRLEVLGEWRKKLILGVHNHSSCKSVVSKKE